MIRQLLVALLVIAPICSWAQVVDLSQNRAAVAAVSGPWLQCSGDNSRFAEPGYDDSTCSKESTSADEKYLPKYENTLGKIRWARLHLRLDDAAAPLSLSLSVRASVPYQIFVNGMQVTESGGFAKRLLWVRQEPVIRLPRERDVTVAIRFYSTSQNLPVLAADVGESDAIRNKVDLAQIRSFGANSAQYYLAAFIYFSLVPVALILFFAQRNRVEYLWLGIYCSLWATFVTLDASVSAGYLPFGGPVLTWVYYYSGFGNMAALLEFVRHFARRRPRLVLRGFQALLLLTPLATLVNQELFYVLLVSDWALQFALTSALLWRGFRRGQTDCGLLMVPLLLFIANGFWSYFRIALGSRVPIKFFLGPLGIDLDANVNNLVALMGIVGVVLYRFLLIAREEERAGAEFEAARQVQRVLVPTETPSIPGFAIEAIYRPAGEVGGDFYQIVPTQDGGVLAIIGDVSGKGMPAAMTVSLLVGAFRTLADCTQRPGEILAAMNRRMIGCNSGGFTTCLVVRLDKDGTLTAANAGHLEPYVDGDGLKTENGLPLGLIAEADYPERDFKLQPDQQVTVMTDGVIEARSKAGELFGFERTAAISSQPAESIVRAAKQFGQEDDITVLTIKHSPANREATTMQELTSPDLSPSLA
jgi:hypothetical protein